MYNLPALAVILSIIFNSFTEKGKTKVNFFVVFLGEVTYKWLHLFLIKWKNLFLKIWPNRLLHFISSHI